LFKAVANYFKTYFLCFVKIFHHYLRHQVFAYKSHFCIKCQDFLKKKNKTEEIQSFSTALGRGLDLKNKMLTAGRSYGSVCTAACNYFHDRFSDKIATPPY